MLRRRDALVGLATLATGCRTRAVTTSTRDGPRPVARWGVQSGDVEATSAVVWTRSDRDARMRVTWSAAESARRVEVVGSDARSATDFTAKTRLALPPDTRIVFDVVLEQDGRASAPVRGSLRTPPLPSDPHPRDVVFAWSADTNGQGFGIGTDGREMPAYAALRAAAPDFFLHLGDAIYADDPIERFAKTPESVPWENAVLTEAKSHVAQTLEDYRGAFLYPRHAEMFREASAHVPIVHLWDDHEVHDNWWPGQFLDDSRYETRAIDVLAADARRAMFEHAPTLRDPSAPMYRSFRAGVHLEVFLLDGRSFRTPNQPEPEHERFLGEAQLAWLTEGVSTSRATWKVVASPMPLGLVVAEPRRGGGIAFDGIASTKGSAPAGREQEIAHFLAKLHERRVENLVWLGADVHYACVQRFDPARAAFRAFTPFHELVAGPIHASSFPQKPLDETFGPEVLFSNAGPSTFGSPADPRSQTFGLARVEGRTGTLIVGFVDGTGRTIHELSLRPV